MKFEEADGQESNEDKAFFWLMQTTHHYLNLKRKSN